MSIKTKLIKTIDEFSEKKILVIGDLMLDHYIFGDAERISPEAPVPVVLVEKEEFAPGGAANVAANLAALGAQVLLFGRVGTDGASKKLLAELKKRNIDTEGIIRDSVLTIQKIRIMANKQQVVRLDKEKNKPINLAVEKKLIKFVAQDFSNCDAVIISDYAKGLITKNIVGGIKKLARKHKKPVIGDTKPAHAPWFESVTVITPNYKEAREVSGVLDMKAAGFSIQKKLKCDLVITQGPSGMTVFQKNGHKYIPAEVKEVFDVAGAGDTVVAILALGLASCLTLREAAFLANKAAGITVSKRGTAVALPEELKLVISN